MFGKISSFFGKEPSNTQQPPDANPAPAAHSNQKPKVHRSAGSSSLQAHINPISNDNSGRTGALEKMFQLARSNSSSGGGSTTKDAIAKAAHDTTLTGTSHTPLNVLDNPDEPIATINAGFRIDAAPQVPQDVGEWMRTNGIVEFEGPLGTNGLPDSNGEGDHVRLRADDQGLNKENIGSSASPRATPIKIRYGNGDTLVVPCKNGVFEGVGVMTTEKGTTKSLWEEGVETRILTRVTADGRLLKGVGKQQFEGGQSFEGEAVQGKGLSGTMRYPEGTQIKGRFRFNGELIRGHGEKKFEDGRSFTGSIDSTNGLSGTMKYSDGREVKGRFTIEGEPLPEEQKVEQQPQVEKKKTLLQQAVENANKKQGLKPPPRINS